MSTLSQLEFARNYTLGHLEKVEAAAWDDQPEGFNNTIRWNAGHIYSSMEYFITLVCPEYTARHPEWGTFFGTGTRPGEWNGNPPSQEELLEALKEQPGRIRAALEGKLDVPAAKPITIGALSMETVGETVEFIVWHEGLHAGVIDALSRITKK